jgi:hypothetical protein
MLGSMNLSSWHKDNILFLSSFNIDKVWGFIIFYLVLTFAVQMIMSIVMLAGIVV